MKPGTKVEYGIKDKLKGKLKDLGRKRPTDDEDVSDAEAYNKQCTNCKAWNNLNLNVCLACYSPFNATTWKETIEETLGQLFRN